MDNLKNIYMQLKDKYNLRLTNTFDLDVGFTEDFPILCGEARNIKFWLYEYADEFVFSVKVPGKRYHDHWHPFTVKDAINDVVNFMEGKLKY